MPTRFAQTTLGLLLALGTAAYAEAETMPAPQGPVILTVSGDLMTIDTDGIILFDRAALTDLPPTTFETSTIWTDGVHSFTGVSLHTLAQTLGVHDGQFLATAINDYTVEIPVSSAVEGGPIIAYLMDGEEMSVRDKGPLWVIYPYDRDADYRTEVIYSRSIWQLERLEILR